jgi:hypothetical protein
VDDNIALASYHHMTAVVYWESAKMLNDSFEARGQPVVGNRMAVPFYYLACHAAEMLLKCALLKRNVLPGIAPTTVELGKEALPTLSR